MRLLRQRFGEEARSLAVWSVTVGLIVFCVLLMTMLMGNLKDLSRVLEKWLAEAPPMLQGFVGGELTLTNPALFILGTVFNTIAPALILVYTVLTTLGFYTREASQGNLEFLFSLPVTRLRLLAVRIAVFLADLAIVHAVAYGAIILGTLVIGERVDAARIALAIFDQYLLFVSLGGLTFLLSLWINDQARGVLILMGLQFFLFFLNMILENKSGLATTLNLYHYYDAPSLLRNGIIPWCDYLVLAVMGILFWTGGAAIFRRKQV